MNGYRAPVYASSLFSVNPPHTTQHSGKLFNGVSLPNSGSIHEKDFFTKASEDYDDRTSYNTGMTHNFFETEYDATNRGEMTTDLDLFGFDS